MSIAANVLFTQVSEHAQMSAKAGIKRFGDRALAAMISEYKQLNTGAVPGNWSLVAYIPNILPWKRKTSVGGRKFDKEKDVAN